MSYLLELLGRGLPGQLADVFSHQLPNDSAAEWPRLARRLESEDSCGDLALRSGAAALRAGRYGDAQRAMERAVALDPQRPLARVGLACVHDARDRLFEALDALREASRLDPDDPAICFGLGMCSERVGQTGAAEEAYTAALQRCDRLRNAYERLAAIAVTRGDWRNTLTNYERLAALEPDDLDVLLTIAALHLQMLRPGTAVEAFQRALLIEPEAGDEIVAAEELLEQGGLDEAITSLERVVRQYPGVTEFRVHLGDLYAKAGQDQAATAEYSAALDLRPTFLEATVKLGTQHLRRRRYDAAARSFNRAAELNDRLLLAFAGLCAAQAADGDSNEALGTLDLAVGLAPNTNLLFAEAARLHLQAFGKRRLTLDEGNDELTRSSDPHVCRALEVLRAACRERPEDAASQYRLSLLLGQLGDHLESLDALRRAVQSDPCFAKAFVRLATGLREAGDDGAALASCRAAFTLTPGAVERHYALALLFAQRTRFDLTLERLLDEGPDDASADLRQSQLLLALQHAGAVDRESASWEALGELAHAGGIIKLSHRPQALQAE